MTLSTANTPERGDAVVEREGARVFLEPGAALMLEDKVLDARVEGNGVQFVVGAQ